MDGAAGQHLDLAFASDSGQSLDLAFALDCTNSMKQHLEAAQECILQIAESLKSELYVDIELALVEYRDHCYSSVTRVHDFTSCLDDVKESLAACVVEKAADNDVPEAVEDALHGVYSLHWRKCSTKICILIADAPAHGLVKTDDHHPKGCPYGHDPMMTSRQLAKKGIVLYVVGCEPAITPYKDWFMALTHITCGQYVPLSSAKGLAKVIKSGVEEELSLHAAERFVRLVVPLVFSSIGSCVKIEKLITDIHTLLAREGLKTKHLSFKGGQLNDSAIELAKCANMKEAKKKFNMTRRFARHKKCDVGMELICREISIKQVERMVLKVIQMEGLYIRKNVTVGTDTKDLTSVVTDQEVQEVIQGPEPVADKASNTDESHLVSQGSNTDTTPRRDQGCNTDSKKVENTGNISRSLFVLGIPFVAFIITASLLTDLSRR